MESVFLTLILASWSKSSKRHSNQVCKCADKKFPLGLSIAGMFIFVKKKCSHTLDCMNACEELLVLTTYMTTVLCSAGVLKPHVRLMGNYLHVLCCFLAALVITTVRSHSSNFSPSPGETSYLPSSVACVVTELQTERVDKK